MMRIALKTLLCLGVFLSLCGIGAIMAQAKEGEKRMAFPEKRPTRASFPRPRTDEVLDVSPPGFCWWRAGDRGKVWYRLKVMNQAGEIACESPLLTDPVHVPVKALPAGRYSWTVEALDARGQVHDTFPARSFTVTREAFAQPWVAPEELLGRVPKEHPRLLFPRASLDAVRGTLETTRGEAFQVLKKHADRALKLKPPPEPNYDEIEDRAQRRMAYMSSFAEMRRYHTSGMVHLSLMYMLTGENKYGDVAKALLLGATGWDPEGISSVMSPHGDEVGLGLARSAAQCYDWLYDLFTEAERERVKKMLVARADQVLRRLEKRDFLARPETSHDGRLPGYLVEHAIALAEDPRARVWMDYAMRAILTVFPHWAGRDGGWAEGVPYGLAYNTIYLTPFESLRAATGFDMWRRPFYRKVRYFFLYNISPKGEIMPFGDTEDGAVAPRASGVRALLQFHALRYNDPIVRWWVNLLEGSDGRPASIAVLPGIILPDVVKPTMPSQLPPDAAFFGVGWAVLHSDPSRPDKDLMVMFKSSPYGPVSHSHADQNSFAIMKGGKALAIPGGKRYPTHGSPFHTKYTQQTMAHNAILVNGDGQKNRDANANGRLTAFETRPHLGYVCGDATAAYAGLLDRCRRHVLLVRPSLICVIDDLGAPEPCEFKWLLHTREELSLDESTQTLISRRDGTTMKVDLITPGNFAFAQTNDWPMSPREGFPKTRKKEPAKQWHFAATTRDKVAKRRIAAVMAVGTDEEPPPTCEVRKPSVDEVEVNATFPHGKTTIRIDLSVDKIDVAPILDVRYLSSDGKEETLSVK